MNKNKKDKGQINDLAKILIENRRKTNRLFWVAVLFATMVVADFVVFIIYLVNK